ncbi:MAG: phospholipid carrier-dependent glycosyltransferase, partial [Parascardovia denticolens]
MGGAMAAKTQMDKKDDETREAIKTPKDGYMPILHGKSAGDGRRINRLPSLGGRGSAPTQYPRPSQ